MGLRLSDGWKMASVVAIVGALVTVFTGQRWLEEPMDVLAILAFVSAAFILVLGVGLLVQRTETPD